MKKILTIVFATLFSFSAAQAVEVTIGVGYNLGVFAAEGKEENYARASNSIDETTVEYGAFDDSYANVLLEVGNEMGAIGLAWHETLQTPNNVNEAAGPGDTNTSSVSVDFDSYVQLYLLARLPFGLYFKGGYGEADVIVNETQKSGNTYNDTSIEGLIAGLGYQYNADNGIGIRAEVMGHSFDDITVNNGKTNTTNLNVIGISDMIGINGNISLVKSF